MIDVKELLQKCIVTELSTIVPPIPAGTYIGVIKNPEVRSFVSQKDQQTYCVATLPIEIDSDTVREATGRKTPTSRLEIFLDIYEDELDTRPYKNAELGRVLAMFDINDGKHSIADLDGRGCYVTVKNVPDNRDPSILRDRVDTIRPL